MWYGRGATKSARVGRVAERRLLMEPKVLKRGQRICFRVDAGLAQEVEAIAVLMDLPRSAVCYLLVALAELKLRHPQTRGEFWAEFAVLPAEVLQAAMRQEKAP